MTSISMRQIMLKPIDLIKLICSVYLCSSLPIQNLIAQDIRTTELQVLFSFPKETDEVLLAYPTAMDLDESGNIFICDFQLGQILKYRPDGYLLKQIGNPGQGPGEFTQQSVFCYSEGRLFVVDQANRRLQILDSEGDYISSFKTISIPHAVLNVEKKILAVLLAQNLASVSKHRHLISTFNETGRLLGGFGNYLDYTPDLTTLANQCFLKIYDNHLYVLFRYYPLLRIYSLDGELKNTIEFTKMNYDELIPGNYDWQKFKNSLRAFPFRYLFNAFDVTEDGIFVGLYQDDIVIDRFSHRGQFQQRFAIEHELEAFYLFDFRVVARDQDRMKFYILNREGIPKLDICIGRLLLN